MRAPAISVLLPVKSAEATIDAAIQSIVHQTFEDWELVVVDNGSTDHTHQRVARWARADARVRLVSVLEGGLVQALNRGLSHCRAPLIARMDADDESLPQRLERSIRALDEHPEWACVGTQVDIFREDRPVSPNMKAYERWLNSLVTPERLFADRLVESPLCHPSVTLRKVALETVGGWEDGPFPEDWHLWLKLLARGMPVVTLPQVLFRWRDHEHRLTRTDPRYAPERITWLKAHALATEVLKRDPRCMVWGAGQVGLSLARALRLRGVRIERFVEVNPRKIGQRIDGIPVHAHTELGSPGEVHLVAAVGAKGARAEIRAFLQERGWHEGAHFTCAA